MFERKSMTTKQLIFSRGGTEGAASVFRLSVPQCLRERQKTDSLTILFFLSLLLLTITVHAGETYSLKRNPPEGKYEINTFTRTMATGKYDIGGNFTLQTLTRYILLAEIKDKKPDGSYTLAYRHKTYKVKKNAPSGTTMEYDSDKPEESEEPWRKIYDVLLNSTFEIRFDPEGCVVSTAGFDEFRKKLDALGSFEGSYEEGRLHWRDYYEPSTIDGHNSFRGVYPNEPVVVGQSWKLPSSTMRTSTGTFSCTGNTGLKSAKQTDGKGGTAIVVTTLNGKQTEPHQSENERGVFTYVSATWKMNRESEFDFSLAEEISSKTTMEMKNHVKHVTKVDAVPDFVLENKGTAVIRTRVTPVKE